MREDIDLLPISALQHLAFCPRQCALIHIEGIWSENALTAQGRVLHEKTHSGGTESRGDLITARGLRLRSMALGLTGVADVVEFHKNSDEDPRPGTVAEIPCHSGLWHVFPVEYKRGRPKPDHCDLVQLCAQAICLEEMMNIAIPRGAIFYGQPRKRQNVEIGQDLRAETHSLAHTLHALIDQGVTPPPEPAGKCRNCSINTFCMPHACDRPDRAQRYLQDVIHAHFPPETEVVT